MRASHLFLALAAVAALGACHRTAASTSAASTPLSTPGAAGQTPGLWEQKVADSHGVRATRYCLDAATAGALAAFDHRLGGRCARRDMAQAADGGWRFSTSCDMGAAGKVASEGVVRGGLDHYVVEAHSQTVAAGDPAANGPGRVKADISRLGDCPADMKPGDVVLPDGSRTRLEALASHA